MFRALPDLTEEELQEVSRVLNDVGLSWKVRRNLLRVKLSLSEDVINALLPPEGDVGDY